MRRLTMVAMVAVLALTGAACGGDDDSGSDEIDAVNDDGTGDSGGDDPTDGAVAAGLLDGDCEFLLAGAFLNPMAAAVPGAEVDVEDSYEQLQAIAEEAPDEIKDAMETLAEGYAAFAEALADVDLSDPQSFSDPELQEQLAELEGTFDEEYEQAGQAVSEYIAAECAG